jgi:cell shape-determining protein MreD
MHLSKYFNSFIIYNIFLIIFFSLTVNGLPIFPIVNKIFYSIFHFLIIYLGIYYYRKKLYLIYFLYGLGFDLIWINEIGPHLIVFMLALMIFYLTFKYLNNLRKMNIYLMLLITQITMILFEMIISQLMFGFSFNLNYFLEIAFLSIIFSYPVFIIFSKIDKFI